MFCDSQHGHHNATEVVVGQPCHVEPHGNATSGKHEVRERERVRGGGGWSSRASLSHRVR